MQSLFRGLTCAISTVLPLLADPSPSISFHEPRVLTVDARSGLRTLVSGDWNGDGRIDLAGGDGQSLWIFEGDGQGGFHAVLELPVGDPVQITAMDLNSDGRSDLLVYYTTPAPFGEFAAFLSEGDFLFAPPMRFRAPVSTDQGPPDGPYVLGFVIADLNRDGFPDLLLTLNPPGRDSVMLGRGDGTFANPIPGLPTFNLIGIADFNSDGVPDVMIRQANGPHIHYGRGDGTFEAPVETDICQPQSWCFVEIVDADGDGSPDLLTGDVSWSWTGNLRVFRGNGRGGFELAARLPDWLAGDDQQGFQLIFTDLNGDRVPDLFRVRVWYADGAADNRAGAYVGDGSGLFALSAEIVLPSSLARLVDVNGDGLRDILTTDGRPKLMGRHKYV